jgi:hypothetical protein
MQSTLLTLKHHKVVAKDELNLHDSGITQQQENSTAARDSMLQTDIQSSVIVLDAATAERTPQHQNIGHVQPG